MSTPRPVSPIPSRTAGQAIGNPPEALTAATLALDEPLMTLQDVRKFTGLCAATVYAQVRRKEFPRPVKFGASSRWVPSQVRAAVLAKLQQSAA
jgi:prophage regulatory protein